MADNQRVKIVCTVAGYEDYWIEFNVSSWGLATYVQVHNELTVPQTLTEFIPRYCVAWRLANKDGTVISHPGQKASALAWTNVWKQFDVVTSRALFSWLWLSVLLAMQEAMALPPKSAADVPSAGTGTEGAA